MIILSVELSDAGTIPTGGGQIILTYYYYHPQSFSPSGITGTFIVGPIYGWQIRFANDFENLILKTSTVPLKFCPQFISY